MVIDDFDDIDMFGAMDGLREFVVIHEDQLAVYFSQKVRLGDDANDAFAVVEYWERLELGGGGQGLGDGERFVRTECEII